MSEENALVIRAGELVAEAAKLPVFTSRATRVTLFEDRAEVSREATVQVQPGSQWVSLSGVTPFVDDRSVQAKPMQASVEVLGLRVARRAFYEPTLGREELERLETEAQAATRRLEAAATAQERARLRKHHADTLLQQWAGALRAAPNTSTNTTELPGFPESFEALVEEQKTALKEAHQAREESGRAEDARSRALARLHEGRIEKPRYEALIELQLSSPAAQELTLEFTYVTPAALWRPEHLARLLVDPNNPQKHVIELTTYATAWQQTGEPWDDVNVSFSTARPAREATPPLLRADVLQLRRKTDEEKKQIVIEAREQTIAPTGVEGARRVEEMPGVDDGGQPLLYAPQQKVSLVSDGRPFRVEISKVRLACELSRVLFPEKAPAAYLRARATLTEGGPLLAGPVQLARDAGLVGRAKLDFIAPGEPFELGFGTDDSIRVRRQPRDQRETIPVLGTQKLKRTIELWLSNLSNEVKLAELSERVPVSEIEEVEVLLLEAEGFRHDLKDGFARLSLRLAANETRTVKLVYEVRAAAKVALPF